MKNDTDVITINLLGPFGISRWGHCLSFPYQKPKMLIAYLVAEGRPVNRSHLSDLLWPHQSQHHSYQSLRQAIASIKRQLGETYDKLFISTRQTIEFIGHKHCIIDTEQLKIAARTISSDSLEKDITFSLKKLYGGAFCQGFHIYNSDEFTQWLNARQQEFCSLAVKIGHKLIERHLSNQQVQEVIQVYTELLNIEWNNETLIFDFMNYLVHQGSQSQAIQLFLEYKGRLLKEAGKTPGYHLFELSNSLIRQKSHASSISELTTT